MSELAQDYTYRVLSVDSSGSSIIRITSYDSLDLDWDLQLRAGDSDGSIAAFVDTVIDHTIHHWAVEREAVPVVTINTPVADRWKPRTTGAFPSYNFLTQYVDSYDSETNDLITTLYSVRNLSPSEKISVYDELVTPRDILLRNLGTSNRLDSAEQYFQVSNAMIKSAAWDGSTGASFDWSNDQISERGIRTVERQAEGHFRVYFETPIAAAKYTAVTGIGDQKYSGAGSSPRQLTVIARDSAYVDVHCERTDDAVGEDNGFFSVHIHPGSLSLTPEQSLLAVRYEEKDGFEFNDSVCTALRTILSINDSDFAALMVE